VPKSARSPPVVAPFTFRTVCPVEVPGAEIPTVPDVLLFVELVLMKTQGYVRFAVDMPVRVTLKVDPPSVMVPAAAAPTRVFSVGGG